MSDADGKTAQSTNGIEQSDTLSPICEPCGVAHIKQSHCLFDLHGEQDFMKSSCAACETEIGPNEPRVGDRYGNIYCGDSCKALGLSILMERVEVAR